VIRKYWYKCIFYLTYLFAGVAVITDMIGYRLGKYLNELEDSL
jgi:hypothetical protein